jgi:peptidyl-prolyl cis-trans isomerase A (cyclophilin A)
MMLLAMVVVVLTTDLGNIEVQLDNDRAPITTANFVKHVSGGFYDGGGFHRTVTDSNQPNNKVKITVIQAGPNPRGERTGESPIKLERTSMTGLRHRDGTISMARDTPDSATLDFFICIGDQPELDFGGKRNPDGQGFAAFGKVISGMDVVRRINASKAEGQKLTPPIKILKAEISN